MYVCMNPEIILDARFLSIAVVAVRILERPQSCSAKDESFLPGILADLIEYEA